MPDESTADGVALSQYDDHNGTTKRGASSSSAMVASSFEPRGATMEARRRALVRSRSVLGPAGRLYFDGVPASHFTHSSAW